MFEGEARLAPVYDLVTTSVYLPKDSMALTLNGTTKWASAKELQRLGETRMGGSPARVREILERIYRAIASTSEELRAYIKDHPDFEDIGNRMLQEWDKAPTYPCGRSALLFPPGKSSSSESNSSFAVEAAGEHRYALMVGGSTAFNLKACFWVNRSSL